MYGPAVAGVPAHVMDIVVLHDVVVTLVDRKCVQLLPEVLYCSPTAQQYVVLKMYTLTRIVCSISKPVSGVTRMQNTENCFVS